MHRFAGGVCMLAAGVLVLVQGVRLYCFFVCGGTGFTHSLSFCVLCGRGLYGW